jgi:hypothetical protein
MAGELQQTEIVSSRRTRRREKGMSNSRVLVDFVLSPACKVVSLLDLVGPDTLGDPYHPEEFVDVVSAKTMSRGEISDARRGGRQWGRKQSSPAVSQETSKDDEDVVDVVLFKDGIRDLLGRRHGLPDGRDVGWTRRDEDQLQVYRTGRWRKKGDALLFHVLLSTSVGLSAIPAIWYP